MLHYVIETTVDITPTGVYKIDPADLDSEKKRSQQRNLDTLKQVISLRSNIQNDQVRVVDENHPVRDREKGKSWLYMFDIEREGVFGESDQLLLQDLHLIPVIPGLDSHIPAIMPPYFLTKGTARNVWIFSDADQSFVNWIYSI